MSTQQEQETPEHCYHVRGFKECRWFYEAALVASKLEEHDSKVKTSSVAIPAREYPRVIQAMKDHEEIGKTIPKDHNSCPIIFQGGCHETDPIKYVGGYAEFVNLAKNQHNF
eukprot:gb/GECH01013961.1/.p1 GENE.gb/GECH01013961.1/~~gb/GECH01013961.1/.p1  ORF type:complete len:112 (+),score=33.15 gb/GECH01013961.1/:1-336(+)